MRPRQKKAPHILSASTAMRVRNLLLHARIREPAVFGMVGFVSTGAYLLTSMVSARIFILDVTLSSIIGHIVSTIVSFSGHHKFTFRKKSQHALYLRRFLVLNGFCYLLNIAIIQITTKTLGLSSTVGFSWVAIIVPIASYLMNKFWVFAARVENT